MKKQDLNICHHTKYVFVAASNGTRMLSSFLWWRCLTLIMTPRTEKTDDFLNHLKDPIDVPFSLKSSIFSSSKKRDCDMGKKICQIWFVNAYIIFFQLRQSVWPIFVTQIHSILAMDYRHVVCNEYNSLSVYRVKYKTHTHLPPVTRHLYYVYVCSYQHVYTGTFKGLVTMVTNITFHWSAVEYRKRKIHGIEILMHRPNKVAIRFMQGNDLCTYQSRFSQFQLDESTCVCSHINDV